ncbi:MAG: universal stress protein [Candidatus Riflebacteria bacterium]|nr:universal stress protein [Candidatus Riflebacteria bacterium]
MFKSILLPTDGSEYSRLAAEYGLILARHYQATVRALHVIDVKKLAGPLIHDVSVCLGVTPPPDFHETFLETSRQLGQSILDEVQKAFQDSGVPCMTLLKTGIVADVICKEAHSVDLVVMGQRGEYSQWGSRIFGSTFEATIRSINKPVFIVPRVKAEIRNVMVAYDGSNNANSVLRVAALACKEENLPMHVVAISEDEEHARELLDEVHDFLEPYELQTTTERMTGPPAESIVAAAKRYDADVLAMGAYGHSRLHELIMGSTTEYVMRYADCPLLLYR